MEEPSGARTGNDRRIATALSLKRILIALAAVVVSCVIAAIQPPHPRPQAERSLLEQLFFPLESNAGLRLPSLPTALHAIRFADDGARGWAAGAGGALLRTLDGGKTWDAARTGTAATLYGLHFTADGRKGWVVGERGAILRTIDGGETWRLQRAPIDTRLTAVTFNNEGIVGWIAGNDGVLLASNDGGETWRPQTHRRGASTSIAINWMTGRGLVLTKQTPAAVGFLTDVASTTGGTGAGSLAETIGGTGGSSIGSPGTGSPIGSPGTGSPGGSPGTGAQGGSPGTVEAKDGSRSESGGLGPGNTDTGGIGGGNTDTGGVGGGNSGTDDVTDGGPVNFPTTAFGGPANTRSASPQAQPQIRELHFDPGGRRFWAFGTKGAIAVATGPGERWRARILDRSIDIADLRFAADGLKGWAVGSGGAIFSTNDGGDVWIRRASGTSADLASVHSTPNGDKIWAAGADGTLVASDDGGESWQALSSGVEAVLQDVEISFDGRHAWAVGGLGLILSSDDGGLTWRKRKSGTRQPLRAVAFDFAGNQGLAVGDSGTILTSEDGGSSWEPLDGGGQADLTDVWLSPLGSRALIARGAGGLLHRVAKGDGWKERPDLIINQVSPVRIAIDGEGLAVGDGGAAVTGNLGNAWRLVVGPGAGDFNAASVADDDTRLIAGEGGLILAAGRDDAGLWARADTGTDASIRSVDMVGSPLVSWAAGEGGTILASNDRGLTWTDQASGTGSARLAISFSRDGAVGVAVGHAPSLLRTADGGATWTSVALPLTYARYPAPWLWPVLLLCCAPLVIPLRRGDAGDEEGAAAIGASDKPTQDFAHDRLQFGPLAMGISRFLRNSRTEPPLTVAISGNWGSGKSSLMQLVCTDLRRHGYRPVWFNAWHHQSDEQLLASLLNSVRQQGLPSLASVDGWLFRFRLLWMRSKKNYVFALVAVAAAAAAAATWISGDVDAGSWTRIGTSIGDLFGDKGGAKGAEVKDAVAPAAVLGALGALFAAYRATRAFGLDPAVLLSSSFNSFRLKDASAQTSFRDRFAEEFEDVAEALPYRMVIVIDDLDRCRPETVMTVMESVNFLVSAGPCFVLFGMARERVLAGLSLTFHSIAKELTELDVLLSTDASEAERALEERKARARYASDYLEKLINIDIKVPAREDIPPHVLLEARAEPPAEGSFRLLQNVWPALLVLAAAGLGMSAPAWLNHPEGPAPRTVAEKAPTAAVTPSPPPRAGPGHERLRLRPAPTPAPAAAIRAPLQTAVVPPGEKAAAWWHFLAGLAIFALMLAAVLRYRSKRDLRDVRDSRAFLGALQTWLPVVQQKRPSPRRIKRFGNFIRYLAMLQQGDPTPELPLIQRLRQFAFPFRVAAVATPAAPPASKSVVEEHRLVALAAVYDAYETKWRDNLWPQGSEPLDHAVRAAIEKVEREATWPPSPEELASFEEAIKGIRFAGTAEVVPAHRNRASEVSEAASDLAEGLGGLEQEGFQEPPVGRGSDAAEAPPPGRPY
jgi:photosystem II stability/assembly factor-like uncharacterized protein